MYRFIESIKLLDGIFYRLKFHQKRMNICSELFYPNDDFIHLQSALTDSHPPQKGLFKCKITFESKILKIEYLPYKKKEINSLRIVHTEIESRPYKKEDRTDFNAAFDMRGNYDDVLLMKNGLLTDTSICNIALFDGFSWQTPTKPLIYGVNRANLLEEGKIFEKDIKLSDLQNYSAIRLFNALIEFGEIELNISNIHF
ncbi:MAG TPA: aminotransferase class IV [Paludibacteraceae bacterium]|nr:aminotransferase class IV [Paludibacteraceae bacterium]HPL76484.1 aminotransferase class IV [Paludibacteraceae bacterium]